MYRFLFTIVFFVKKKNNTHKTFHLLKMKAHFEKKKIWKQKSIPKHILKMKTCFWKSENPMFEFWLLWLFMNCSPNPIQIKSCLSICCYICWQSDRFCFSKSRKRNSESSSDDQISNIKLFVYKQFKCSVWNPNFHLVPKKSQCFCVTKLKSAYFHSHGGIDRKCKKNMYREL